MSPQTRWKCLAMLLVLGVACYSTRISDTWEFPGGYAGWAYVQYGNPACPPLPMANGRRLIRIPADGRLCTSSSYNTGYAADEFAFVYADGARTRIPSDEVSSRVLHTLGNYESLYIGRPSGQPPDPSPFR